MPLMPLMRHYADYYAYALIYAIPLRHYWLRHWLRHCFIDIISLLIIFITDAIIFLHFFRH
jgi:hypothetical protein